MRKKDAELYRLRSLMEEAILKGQRAQALAYSRQLDRLIVEIQRKRLEEASDSPQNPDTP